MPRVSDAYRRARRDEIVAAALRVLRRRGLHELTMADIIEEAGLSAGSVYSHFFHKNEIVELVATEVVGARLDLLTAKALDDDVVRSPREVVRWWLTGLQEDGVSFATLVQIWGEAASDATMKLIVQQRVSEIEEGFTAAAKRWLLAEGGEPEAAKAAAFAMLTFCQGYVVRSAVLGPQDMDASLASVALLAQ